MYRLRYDSQHIKHSTIQKLNCRHHVEEWSQPWGPLFWTFVFVSRNIETPEVHPVSTDIPGWGTSSGPSSISHPVLTPPVSLCPGQMSVLEKNSPLGGKTDHQDAQNSGPAWWPSPRGGVCVIRTNLSVAAHGPQSSTLHGVRLLMSWGQWPAGGGLCLFLYKIRTIMILMVTSTSDIQSALRPASPSIPDSVIVKIILSPHGQWSFQPDRLPPTQERGLPPTGSQLAQTCKTPGLGGVAVLQVILNTEIGKGWSGEVIYQQC